MKTLLTISLLLSLAYGQKISIGIGNAAIGTIEYKGVQAELIRPMTLNSNRHAIGALNLRYKYAFAGWSTDGLSMGATYQRNAYSLTAGIAGRYGYASLNVNSIKSLTKWDKDIPSCALFFLAGAANAVRDQVIFHPNELFAQHPYLNRNWWDSRVSWQNGSGWNNANHFFKGVATYSMIAGAVLSWNDFKKPNIKKILFKAIKYTACYKAGWYVMWYGNFGNKL
jgi:hypothetical protein